MLSDPKVNLWKSTAFRAFSCCAISSVRSMHHFCVAWVSGGTVEIVDASRGGPRGIGANDRFPFKMVVSRTGGRKRRRPGAARADDDESQLPKSHGERREVAVRRNQDESFHVAVEGVRAVGCRRRSGPRGEGAEKAPLEIPMTKRDFLRESARKTPQLPSWRKRPVPPSSQDPTPIRCGPRGLQFLLFPFRP